MKRSRLEPFLSIAWVGTLPLLALPFLAVPDALNYRYAAAFLVPLLWGVYFSRRALLLEPVHFALFALALLLHNLGALGFYRRSFLGLAFDTFVHFYFGVVGGLILERIFRKRLGLTGWQAWLGTMVFLLGLGAIHELVELASTLQLGDRVGMYKLGNTDEFDTHKDMLNNALGSLTASAVAWLQRWFARRRA